MLFGALGAGGALVVCCGLLGLYAVLSWDWGRPPTPSSERGTRVVAPGETTPESVDGMTSPDRSTVLTLGDGTQVSLPTSAKPVAVRLSRLSNTVQPPQPALQTSGSMRTLEFDSSQVDERFMPILTIPAKELGDLALATVNLARVSDVQANGVILKNQVMYLPVRKDNAGNLVALDMTTSTLVEAAASTSSLAGGSLPAKPPAQAGGRTTVKYVVMTFQNHLEWQIEPQLVRMIPDAAADGLRRPADPTKDKDLLQMPVVNVLVLVHGHNEEEKDGTTAPSAPEPWKVTYKRNVWTELYKEFLDGKQDQLDCTAFYEYIYPSFRSAYTPIEGNPAEPLGDSFLKALKYGAVNDGHQLEKMRQAQMPVNLLITAHSMGGLVSRAAIRQFDGWLKDSFRQLVTWGTPHHGSPLETLSYALRGPYRSTSGSSAAGILGRILGSDTLQWALDTLLVLDTPGTRDNRWDNIEPLRLDEMLYIAKDAIPKGQNEADYSLTTGSWLYNDNLRLFNQNDPYQNSEAYYFLYGVTPRRFRKPYIFLETALGATLIPELLKDSDAVVPVLGGRVGESDGAVPLASMAGLYLVTGRADRLDGVDHEEYYSPDSNLLYGGMVARRTFDRLGLPQARCQCPRLALLTPTGPTALATGSDLKVEAQVTWPIKVTNKAAGWPVTQAEAQVYINGTKNVHSLGYLSVTSTGVQAGSFAMPDLGAGRHQQVVRATFADGTALESDPVPISMFVKPKPGVNKCMCPNGKPLALDPSLGCSGLLMPPTNDMVEWRFCFRGCVEACGCDPDDPDLTCACKCVLGK